jgi:hypothetical protein
VQQTPPARHDPAESVRLSIPLTIAALALPSVASPPRAAIVAVGSPADPLTPHLWPDAAGVAGDPLDLRAVSFGQRDTLLWLTVRTAGGFAGGGRICLVVRARRLCVGATGGVSPAIPGAILDRRASTLRLVFHPRAARLAFGRASWYVDTGGDRAPDVGRRSVQIGPLGEPPCYGAAARPGQRVCLDPALARTVRPTPDHGYLMPDAPCRPLPIHGRYAVLRPCAFGDLDSPRHPVAALVGDSHARVLRAAVEVVAQAKGWRAVTLSQPGCVFSTESSRSPDGSPFGCRVHSEEALTWLRRHPSVHIVFTAANSRGYGAAGFAAMWARVPRSVRRIYVIRDVPHMSLGTADCVTAVIRRHAHRPWRDCAVPRAVALPPDPAAEAAASAPSRVRLIDLSRHFCDAARCYPVVGGLYAYKDTDHINRWFSTTLGPYLLRSL